MRRLAFLLMAGLAACQIPRDEGTGGPSGASFPHPEGWAEGALHGASALLKGTAACTTCHQDGGAVPCATCHTVYPHPAGFRDGSAHGNASCEEGTAGCLPCAACHENPTLVASRTAHCTACHASYPHASDWDSAHGPWAVGRGEARAPCGPCHGDASGSPAAYCGTCHTAWPHPVGYADPTSHGAGWAKDPPSCGVCHGSHGEGTASSPACSRCHAGFPHTDGWSHLAQATRLGEGTCLACHEAGDGPAGVPTTCAPVCHGGTP
jgi:hypothetical protein